MPTVIEPFETVSITDTKTGKTEYKFFIPTPPVEGPYDKQVDDGDSTWFKSPYAIVLGKNFTTYKQAAAEVIEKDAKAATDKNTSQRIMELMNSLPDHYSRPSFSDTSVGGNDAINPYWSFNEDDDIILPMDDYRGDGKSGLGSIYKEMYQQHQQILWMTFGVPQFTSAYQFMKELADPDMASIMNSGESFSVARLIGKLIGEGIVLAIELPWLPLIWTYKVVKKATTIPITKYYDFKSSMTLYYRMVNVILSHLAVSMGLYGNPGEGANSDKYKSMYAEAGIPEILKYGPDIFAIVDKRGALFERRERYTTEKLVQEIHKDPSSRDASVWDKFTHSLKTSMLGGSDFIGFRIEKSTDSSESISNSTGQSQLASSLNAKSSEGMEKRFNASSVLKTFSVPVIDKAIKTVLQTAKHVAYHIGVEGATEIITGGAFADIPDIWKGSSFSKSYNFTVALRARAGDPVSIYQSIYVPLAMLLAAALPRQVGKNAYTSPFVVRAYCKGMFAVPLGMIESMSIKRGAAEFGWNLDNLPTAVDVSFTIKDLSPALFLGLVDEGWLDVFQSNSSLIEYLDTLAGVGLQERYYMMQKMKRKVMSTLLIQKNTTFNPYYWGNKIGNSALFRAIAAVSPVGYVPRN